MLRQMSTEHVKNMQVTEISHSKFANRLSHAPQKLFFSSSNSGLKFLPRRQQEYRTLRPLLESTQSVETREIKKTSCS